MNDWYSNIYKALIISCAVSFIIGFFTGGNVSLDAYITGYSVLIISVFLIIMVILNGNGDKVQGSSILMGFMNAGPFLLMLLIIGFMLYLLIKYKDLIIDEKVSKSFFTFSSVMISLLIIQLYLIYTNITTPKFKETGKISKLVISILYLLGLLSGITSVILFTILKKFTTDGFQSI